MGEQKPSAYLRGCAPRWQDADKKPFIGPPTSLALLREGGYSFGMKYTTISMTVGDDWLIPIEFNDENDQPWTQAQMDELEWEAKYAPSYKAPAKNFDILSIEGNVLTLSLPRDRTRVLGRSNRLVWTVRGFSRDTGDATTYVSGTILLRQAVA